MEDEEIYLRTREVMLKVGKLLAGEASQLGVDIVATTQDAEEAIRKSKQAQPPQQERGRWCR